MNIAEFPRLNSEIFVEIPPLGLLVLTYTAQSMSNVFTPQPQRTAHATPI